MKINHNIIYFTLVVNRYFLNKTLGNLDVGLYLVVKIYFYFLVFTKSERTQTLYLGHKRVADEANGRTT